MPDEKDILLKVGVDASDVAKGIADVKAGLGEMNASAAGPAAGGAATPADTTAALTGQAAAASQVAESTGDATDANVDFGASNAAAEKTLMSLMATVGGVDVKTVKYIRTLLNLQMVAKLAFSPMTWAVGAAIAAIGLLSNAIQTVIEKTQKARREWDALLAAQAEARAGRAAKTEGVAAELAKVGMVGGDELRKGEVFARKAREKGYGEAAIGKVAPLAAGGKMTDEEIQQVLAMEEYQPGTVDIKTPKDMAKAPEKLRRLLAKKQADVAGYQTAATQRQGRLTERASMGEEDAVLKRLEQLGEEIPADAEKRSAIMKDIRDVAEGGLVDTGKLNMAYQVDRDELVRRQKDAARRGQAAGMISKQRAWAISEVTPGEVDTARFWGGNPFGETGPAEIGGFDIKSKVAAREKGYMAQAQPAMQPATQPATVVNNYHGPVYTGGPGGGAARVVRAP